MEEICSNCLEGIIDLKRSNEIFCIIDREYLLPTDTCADIVLPEEDHEAY